MRRWSESVSDHPHHREWNRRDIRPRRRTRRHQRSHTNPHLRRSQGRQDPPQHRNEPPLCSEIAKPAQGSFERKTFISLITSASFDLKM